MTKATIRSCLFLLLFFLISLAETAGAAKELNDTDASCSVNASTVIEGGSVLVTVTYVTNNFGTGSGTWTVNLKSNDTNGNINQINGSCETGDGFRVTAIDTSDCPGGQTCTANVNAGTIALTWAKSKTAAMIWTIQACSGASTNSPYNVTTNVVTAETYAMTWSTSIVVDATPPAPTVNTVGGDSAAPWSTSDTTPSITLTLDENGDCWASESDESYDDMSNDVDCSGDGGTSITCQMGALAESASKTIYVACKDTPGNKDTVATNEHITLEIDATPPAPTVNTVGGDSAAPWSTSDTTPSITLTLDENGDCWASETDESYDDMSNDVDCSGDGGTSITCQMGALAESASKTIYVACKDDTDVSPSKDTVATNEHITLEIDATPPAPSGYDPPNESTIASTSQTLTFNTNEIGDCFASLDSDESYDQMSDDFDCTSGTSTSHSCSLSGLIEGANTIYIACEDNTDSTPNKDTADTNEYITLTVELCSVAIGLSPTLGSGITWTVDSLPKDNLAANGNNGAGVTEYSVSISATGCTADLYIKASGNLADNGNTIALGGETYCYSTTDNTVPGTACTALDTDYAGNQIGSNLAGGSVYLKFYLDVPDTTPPGSYVNTVYIKGVQNGETP